MKITLYYDDCRHHSSDDYPFEYLKKDRVIEIWIEGEE